MIFLKCPKCGVKLRSDEIPLSIERNENPKWYQVSHKYLPRKCNKCGTEVMFTKYSFLPLFGIPLLLLSFAFLEIRFAFTVFVGGGLLLILTSGLTARLQRVNKKSQ